MITAIDSSVLIDILQKDPNHWEKSLYSLQQARQLGSLIVCPMVWAEVSVCFEDTHLMRGFFKEAGIQFDPFLENHSELAGKIWKQYRKQGGSRKHLVADFLVAAHAMERCSRLLTRDRGFYRNYFKTLEVIEP